MDADTALKKARMAIQRRLEVRAACDLTITKELQTEPKHTDFDI